MMKAGFLVLSAVWLVAGSSTAAEPRSRSVLLTGRATIRDVPRGAAALEVWIPLPQTDASQTIHRLEIDVPARTTITREPREGNQMLYVRIEGPREPVSIGWTVA